MSENEKDAGRTPITWYGAPLMLIERPMTPASASKFCRQNVSLRRTTAAVVSASPRRRPWPAPSPMVVNS